MMARKHRGFTLLEVLVGASLLTGLLLAGVALAVQLSLVLAAQVDDPVFDRHVDGLERFLRAYAARATAESTTAPETTGLIPSLRMEVPAGTPILQRKRPAKKNASMRLKLTKDKGLWLTWIAESREKTGPGERAEVLLSPLVRDVKVYRLPQGGSHWIEESEETGNRTDKRAVFIELSDKKDTRVIRILWPDDTQPITGKP